MKDRCHQRFCAVRGRVWLSSTTLLRGENMAKDMSDTVRDALTGALKQAVKSASDAGPAPKKRSSPFGGAKGIAAGAGLAAAAPLAKKGVDKIRSGAIPMSASGLVSKAGDSVGSKL